MFKGLLSVVLCLMLVLMPMFSTADIGGLHGFDQKVYDSTFALYGTSGIHTQFLCTVTAFKQVKDGYLLIGAGHCTTENGDLPQDLTYSVARDMGGQRANVKLLAAKLGDSGLPDYAIYFLATKNKYTPIELGDENTASIDDKTIDVNFSLGVVKMVSRGVIVSKIVTHSADVHGDEENGYYLVQEFDSHGASGSAVVSEKTHKIIGLVIAGWDGSTMPSLVEPITIIEKEIASDPAVTSIK